MASVPFEFDPDKLEAALEYVDKCFRWLAAGGHVDIARVAELDFDEIVQTVIDLPENIYSAQNRLAPINRLPPELLGIIFEHLIEDPPVVVGTGYHLMDYWWPEIQSVCRHWRHIAVHTPVLWSYMHVNVEALERQSALALTSLKRSRALPLTIYLLGDIWHEVDDSSLLENIKSHSGRVRELRLDEVEVHFLDLYLQKADGLEVLVVNEPLFKEEYDDNVNSWHFPKLRTLVMNSFTGWNGANFRTLRHLILEEQPINFDYFHGLHALLALNPQLEDLVLLDMHWEDLLEEWLSKGSNIGVLPPLNMPNLRRIAVRTLSSEVTHELVEKRLVLQAGHAKVYYSPLSAAPQFPFQQKLFIGSHTCIVSTDGRSSYRIDDDFGRFYQECVIRSTQSQPKELWLWSFYRYMRKSDFDWTVALKALQGVKKIVLARDIPSWLSHLSEHHLFPNLTELQIHRQQPSDFEAITYFLEQRLKAPFDPIRILRFVPRTAKAVEGWQEISRGYARLVPNVVLENPDALPLRMELPSICTTGSTVHAYWPSWEVAMH
ncbi:hypothetical protein BC835DRAFT_1307033 [Cytidiella melzeri]|nr:hypothetical protein BC835DRAFT_1307033 [Cytidiella melzeri]